MGENLGYRRQIQSFHRLSSARGPLVGIVFAGDSKCRVVCVTSCLPCLTHWACHILVTWRRMVRSKPLLRFFYSSQFLFPAVWSSSSPIVCHNAQRGTRWVDWVASRRWGRWWVERGVGGVAGFTCDRCIGETVRGLNIAMRGDSMFGDWQAACLLYHSPHYPSHPSPHPPIFPPSHTRTGESGHQPPCSWPSDRWRVPAGGE